MIKVKEVEATETQNSGRTVRSAMNKSRLSILWSLLRMRVQRILILIGL